MVGAIAAVVGGLILLVWGGEWLVRGAERLALSFRMSPLVIGLTVVAFGTSAPELAVTMRSAFLGSAIGIGNVVGSNIFNVLAILGLSAAIVSLVVSSALIKRDVPIMIGVTVLTYAACMDGKFTRWEGIAAFSILIGYTWWLVIEARREQPQEQNESASPRVVSRTPVNLFYVVAGLAFLVLGSRWLVLGGIEIARLFGVSDLIIGLTIVAVGTSLPEVMTSVVAAIHGQRDIAVGNIVGSNIFNLLCVMGLSAVVAPAPLEISNQALRFDFPIMLAVSFVCLPIFWDGVIARWEGILFLLYYLAYVTYLILDQTGSAWHAPFAAAMLFFCIPLTLLTLIVLTLRH